MRKIICIAIAAAMLAVAPSVQADTWKSWTSAGNDGGEYWDNRSSDGNGYANIGYYLTKTGDYVSRADYEHPGNIKYLANIDGTAVSSWGLTYASAEKLSLKFEWAGYAGVNEFGWFAMGNKSALHTIFAGADSAGASYTLTMPVGTAYGFYFKSNGNTWYTDGNGDHFALFQADSGTYWLGMEDLPLAASDKDYNDMIVKISSSPVPEPGTILLLGFGLIGAAGIRRKLRK